MRTERNERKKRVKRDKSSMLPMIFGMIGVVILSVILLASLFAPLLAPYEPNAVNLAETLKSPSKQHLLGTDLLGRDMFSRILYGGRSSILLSLIATVFSMLLGMAVGTLAGYYGGILDEGLMVIINIFQGLPETCFMVAIAGIMGPSLNSLLLAIVITSWTGFAKIIRTEVMKLREESFVKGLICLGAGDFRIIWKHIVPNLKGNTIVLFTTRVGRCMLSLSGLSFLGLGIQPPNPDWSVMLNDARMNFRSAPHLVLVPGLCLMVLLLSINLIGDMLRDILDKKRGEAGGYD